MLKDESGSRAIEPYPWTDMDGDLTCRVLGAISKKGNSGEDPKLPLNTMVHSNGCWIRAVQETRKRKEGKSSISKVFTPCHWLSSITNSSATANHGFIYSAGCVSRSTEPMVWAAIPGFCNTPRLRQLLCPDAHLVTAKVRCQEL